MLTMKYIVDIELAMKWSDIQFEREEEKNDIIIIIARNARNSFICLHDGNVPSIVERSRIIIWALLHRSVSSIGKSLCMDWHLKRRFGVRELNNGDQCTKTFSQAYHWSLLTRERERCFHKCQRDFSTKQIERIDSREQKVMRNCHHINDTRRRNSKTSSEIFLHRTIMIS